MSTISLYANPYYFAEKCVSDSEEGGRGWIGLPEKW
jgi:hypothetical protein